MDTRAVTAAGAGPRTRGRRSALSAARAGVPKAIQKHDLRNNCVALLTDKKYEFGAIGGCVIAAFVFDGINQSWGTFICVSIVAFILAADYIPRYRGCFTSASLPYALILLGGWILFSAVAFRREIRSTVDRIVTEFHACMDYIINLVVEHWIYTFVIVILLAVWKVVISALERHRRRRHLNAYDAYQTGNKGLDHKCPHSHEESKCTT